MADDLKRVGLVFKEDGSTDFIKTLNLVNGTLRENYAAFQLTQAQWDKSTTSTQKLKDKLVYLNDAYDIQRDKVNTLKAQLEELESAENKDEVAIQKKKAALAQTETALQKYSNQIKETEKTLNSGGLKFLDFGEKATKTGESLEKAGKKVSAFSLAVAGALGLALKEAIGFESAFAGVEKTVDGTEQQMEKLKQGIRNMSKEIPSTTKEISAVAEAAGQLGIETDNVLEFAKVMTDMGNSTNLSAETAATTLARFANITKMSQKDFNKLGSTIVELGNNFATTESDITAMAMRLAGAGSQLGMAESEILGVATALSSVGIEAEMGGSAFSKALVRMKVASETGNNAADELLKTIQSLNSLPWAKNITSIRELELLASNSSADFKDLAAELGMTKTELNNIIKSNKDLSNFAKVARVDMKEFARLVKNESTKALELFIKGLANTEETGESAIEMLQEMGLTEVRLRDALLRSANASDVFSKAVKMGNTAWSENTALTNEANKRYETLESKIKMAGNQLRDMGITIGEKLMPSVEKIISKVGEWIDKFSKLDSSTIDTIVKIGLVVAAAGPLITIFGKVTSTIGTVSSAIGVMKTGMATTNTAVNGLASVFTGLTSPIGLATTALTLIAGAVALGTAEYKKHIEEVGKLNTEIENEIEARDELIKKQNEQIENNTTEIENTEKLSKELNNLVDENGRVKKGYEGRVDFILGELNKALGTEYKQINGVIDGYKNLQSEIDNLIRKKKAEIYLNAQLPAYEEATKNEASAVRNLNKAKQEYIDKEQEILKNFSKYGSSIEEIKTKMYELADSKDDFANTQAQLIKNEIDDLDIKNKAIENANKIYRDYSDDIISYERDMELVTKNTNKSIDEVLNKHANVVYENGKKIKLSDNEQLEQLIQNTNLTKQEYNTRIGDASETETKILETRKTSAEQQLKTEIKKLADMTSTVSANSPAIVNQWKSLAKNSYDTYKEEVSKMPPEMRAAIQKMTGVIVSETTLVDDKTKRMAGVIISNLDTNEQLRKTALHSLNGYLKGLSDSEKRQLLKEAGVKDVEQVMKGLEKGDLSEDTGINILKGLLNGVNSTTWINKIKSTASGIAKSVLKAANDALGIHSPSKEFEKTGIYSIQGLEQGLRKEEDNLYKQTENIAENMLDTINEVPREVEGIESSLNRNNNIQNGMSRDSFDYNQLFIIILKALNSCKLALDEDGFIRLIDNRLIEVM